MQTKPKLLWFPQTVNRYSQVAPQTTGTMLQDTAEQFAAEAFQARSIQKLLSVVSLHNASYSFHFDSTKKRRKKKKTQETKPTKEQRLQVRERHQSTKSAVYAKHRVHCAMRTLRGWTPSTNLLSPFSFWPRKKKAHSTFYSYKARNLFLRALGFL